MKNKKERILPYIRHSEQQFEENRALEMAKLLSKYCTSSKSKQFVTFYSREMYSQYTYVIFICIYILNKYYI